MVSTYSPSLRLELMATGDQSGTWGNTTNTNLGTLLEQAITGVLSKPMADADQTLTTSNGVSDEARNAVVIVTGALTAARTVTVPDENKLYLFRNETTGGFAVTIKTAAGTGVSVPFGTARWVYCDGTNVVDGMVGTQGYSYTGNFLFVGDRTFSLLSDEGTGLMFGSTTPAPDSVRLRLAGADVLNIGSGTATLSASTLSVESTDPGTNGPFLDGYHNKASPTVGDIVVSLRGLGKNASAATTVYGRVAFTIQDTTAGSEDGRAHIQTMNNGVFSDTLTVDGASVRSLVQIRAADGNAAVPGYGFAGLTDFDTGLFHPADGVIAFTCNAVETGRINTTEFLLGQTAGWNPSVTALRGINITKNGQFIASNVSNLAGSFVRMTTDGRVLNTYRDTTNVGGATVSTTATSWDTASDEEWKNFIGVYDPMKAIDIIRRDPVRDFYWNHLIGEGEGTYAVGWGAQTSYKVSKDLASPGGWFDPHSGEPVEPRSHRWMDPLTGETVAPNSVRWVDPVTRETTAPNTVRWINPVTRESWVKGGQYRMDAEGRLSTETEGTIEIRAVRVVARRIEAVRVDAEYRPWGVDQGKRTPYLWAAVTWLLDERDALLKRLERLEVKMGLA